MRKAGCIEIKNDVDYRDEVVLKNLSKDISLDCVSDAVNRPKKSGLQVSVFFVFNVLGRMREPLRKPSISFKGCQSTTSRSTL